MGGNKKSFFFASDTVNNKSFYNIKKILGFDTVNNKSFYKIKIFLGFMDWPWWRLKSGVLRLE